MIARMARLVFALLFALITGTLSGLAQSGELDLRGVGLIDLGLAGGCTGTLIQADLVLTAGHCLLPHIGGPEAAAKLTFHPTTSNGAPGQEFRARLLLVHPVFELPGLPTSSKLSRDIGLMQLERPVPESIASPIPTGRLHDAHQKGFVVSFRGRGGGPARQRACLKIAASSGVVELGCEVKSGESGAPYLVFSDGQLQVMAVITSRWQNKAQPTALAVELSASLAGLLEAYYSAQN